MLLHHLHKPPEQILRIMRPRRRLRMMLHREDRQVAVADPFHGLVIQVFMPQTGGIAQRIQINGKTVILGGNLHLAGGHIHNRQVGTMVAEGELDGLAAQGQSKQLVPQTDAEDRFFADKLSDFLPAPAPAVPGRPGRWRERCRPDSWPEPLQPGKVAGTTVTSQPASTRQRRILYLMPKS